MPYVEHPQCQTPSDDALLWRYMDFVKFVHLLESQRLWLTRLDLLDDPREGRYTNSELAKFRKAPKDMLDVIPAESFVSCWHESGFESMAMWDLYGGKVGSLAIKSSVTSIKQAIQASVNVMIGRIKYIDWSSQSLPPENVIALCVRKAEGYRHESEVRLVAWEPTLGMSEMGAEAEAGEPALDLGRLANQFVKALRQTYPSMKCDDEAVQQFVATAILRSAREDYIKAMPRGIGIEVELQTLVREIVVGPREPEWIAELVKSVLSKYDMSLPVKRSALRHDGN